MSEEAPDINDVLDQQVERLSQQASSQKTERLKRLWQRMRSGALGVALAASSLAWAFQGQVSMEEVLAQGHGSLVRAAHKAGLNLNMHFDNSRLEGLAQDLRSQSPTFAVYYQAIQSNPDHHVVFEDMERTSSRAPKLAQRAEDLVGLATYSAVVGSDDIEKIVISIDLGWFDRRYGLAMETLPEFEDELKHLKELSQQSVLAHEMGHAVSMALTDGEYSCEDPSPDNPAHGCSLLRENQVNAEIGHPINAEYGVDSPFDTLALFLLEQGDDQKIEQLLELSEERHLILSSAAYDSLMEWWSQEANERLQSETTTSRASPSRS